MSGPDKYAQIPATRRSIKRLETANALLRLQSVTVTAVTDNSTGAGSGTGAAVKTLRSKFKHVSGSDLALKSAADTAFGTANDGIAVLKGLLNIIGTATKLATITGGNGSVVTPGTIPAVTKAITGTDGATAVALSRAGGNAYLKFLRDQLSTLYIAHNRMADQFGLSRIMDLGEGVGSVGLVLTNPPATGAAVDQAGDAMPKAFLDAQMTIVANNIAYLGRKYAALRTYAADNMVDLTP